MTVWPDDVGGKGSYEVKRGFIVPRRIMQPLDKEEHDHIDDLLKSFGWEITAQFEYKYLIDPWVFNLTNALDNLAQENKRLNRIIIDLKENNHMNKTRHGGIIYSTRRVRDGFRLRYWVECIYCKEKLGPFKKQKNVIAAHRIWFGTTGSGPWCTDLMKDYR